MISYIQTTVVQFNNIFKMFDSAQNQYFQLIDEEDCADIWFEDIDNQVFECKHKIYNRLWEAERDLQGLQEGETNQVKAVHTAVQKILTLLLIQKSQRN